MVPRSQKNLPISFLILDGDDYVTGVDLIIRPEEMTRTEPQRVNTHQTLGGAWVDDFGRGLSTITIAGNTGWHGSQAADGVAQFERLRAVIVERWPDLRAARAKDAPAGKSVDDIMLVLANRLDGYVAVVVPQQFQLRRHKTRPLLMQYHMTMTVLGPLDDWRSAVATHAQDAIAEAVHNQTRHAMALAALEEARRKQAEAGAMINKSFGVELVEASRMILQATDDLLDRVIQAMKDGKGLVDDVTGPLLGSSALILEASRNAYRILAALGDTAEYARIVLMRIAANYNDALCNLMNGFRRFLSMPDFSDLFGASTCSSTGGGRPISPWAPLNPFDEMIGTPTRAALTQDAREAMTTLLRSPVGSPLTRADVTSGLKRVAGGIVA